MFGLLCTGAIALSSNIFATDFDIVFELLSMLVSCGGFAMLAQNGLAKSSPCTPERS